MTNEELVEECKIGLGFEGNGMDVTLRQKLLAVKGFMSGAGVSNESMEMDLAVGTIVMGVTDLWELKSGEVKFSPVFFVLVNQLASG